MSSAQVAGMLWGTRYTTSLARSFTHSALDLMVKSYAQTLLLKDDPAGIATYKEYHQVRSWRRWR